MLTAKKICGAVKEATGESVGLFKHGGVWYWADGIAINFYESCTHMTRLNDQSLDRWVDDFKYKLSRADY